MNFDAEFKKALQLLSETEKDKLILRLLKRDPKLAGKLYFELVDTESVQDKREQLRSQIIRQMQLVSKEYYSPGYLLMDVRDISSKITEHVTITKDKIGEISLNCLMLRTLLDLNNERIMADRYGNAYKLCIYIVARIYKILMLIQKQHEDLHLEFEEDIRAIGIMVGQNRHLMGTAIKNGLDVNWLIQYELPENISAIYKELKENGLLK